MPMRVVLDEPDLTVAWLAPATPIMYWATAAGRDHPLARGDGRGGAVEHRGLHRWVERERLFAARHRRDLGMLPAGVLSQGFIALSLEAHRTTASARVSYRGIELRFPTSTLADEVV